MRTKSFIAAIVVSMVMTVWMAQSASADPTRDSQRQLLWAIHDSHGEATKAFSDQEAALVRLAMSKISDNQPAVQMTTTIQKLSSGRIAHMWKQNLSDTPGLTPNDGRGNGSVSGNMRAKARHARLSSRTSLVNQRRSLAGTGSLTVSPTAGPSNSFSGANTNAIATTSFNPSGLNTFATELRIFNPSGHNTFAVTASRPGSIVSGYTIISGSTATAGGAISGLTLPASCKLTSHSTIDCSQP